MTQLVTPNPNIWCRPGWCLQYVRETFRITPGVHPTATAGWWANSTKHRDWNFPAGHWVPVWFSLAKVPAGHVALLAPDGSVYSTSDDSNTPHRHPNLQHLLDYYSRYGQPITYLGWTEDIENVAVVDLGSLGYAGETITIPQEDELSAEAVDKLIAHIDARFDNIAAPGVSGQRLAGPLYDVARGVDSISASLAFGEAGVRQAGSIALLLSQLAATPDINVEADAAAIAKALTPGLAKALLVELSKGA